MNKGDGRQERGPNGGKGIWRQLNVLSFEGVAGGSRRARQEAVQRTSNPGCSNERGSTFRRARCIRGSASVLPGLRRGGSHMVLGGLTAVLKPTERHVPFSLAPVARPIRIGTRYAHWYLKPPGLW